MDKKSKYCFLVLLFALTIISIMPPILHDYIYPTAGDDSATHMMYFENMGRPVEDYYVGHPPVPVYPLYYGQYIVGKLMNALPFDVPTSFLWFNYIVLALAVWAVGMAVALAYGYYAGALASLLVFGRSYLLTQFYWGVIFDIAGVAVLLPIMLLCLHKYDRGVGWKLGAVASGILFAVFHANGKYLIALMPVFVAYEITWGIMRNKGWRISTIMTKYRMLVYLGCLCAALLVAYGLGLSVDPGRILLDASVLGMMMAAGVIAVLIGDNWKYALAVGIVAVAAIIPQMQYWMKDNSALRSADEQAIKYVNGLPGATYATSLEITRNIYGLYMQKQWADTAPDYYVMRSIPMTETSAIAVKHEVPAISLAGYRLLTLFDNGDRENFTGEPITVAVYAKAD